METQEPKALGIEDLKALAHPLRVQIIGALSAYGPATCSTLAARLGESSGSMSYHLRQLERHGLVREDPARGNARDRWWERIPGPIRIDGEDPDAAPALREASALVGSEFDRVQDRLYAEFQRSRASLPVSWQRAQDSSSAVLVLTVAEIEALADEMHAVIDRFRGRSGPGDRRRVDVVFRAFPIVDPGVDTTTIITTDAPEGASS